MTDLYLITGFLGAGKTTFLKNFIRLFHGRKIQLIINEFGKQSVDGAILAEFDALLKEITGGSVFCSCRQDQFEKALTESIKTAPDVIIVEASGLSDPTGVRKLFSKTQRFPIIRYKGAVCLVDATRFEKVYSTARVCARQLASSDTVLLNKVDLASKEQLDTVVTLIKSQRPDIPIMQTVHGQIPTYFLDAFENSPVYENNLSLIEDLTNKSICLTLSDKISSYELEKLISMFAEHTFRVKGFVKTSDLGTVLADCVGTDVSVLPYNKNIEEGLCGSLVILSGAKMPIVSALKLACKWYCNFVISCDAF